MEHLAENVLQLAGGLLSRGEVSSEHAKVHPDDTARVAAYIFYCCIFSLLFNVFWVFLPSPWGLWTPTEATAETEWSYGCQDGLESCLCARETTCADDVKSVIFLAIARSGVYYTYPLYMMLFFSKSKCLMTYLQTTALSAYLPMWDAHHLHVLAGTTAAFDTMNHSLFHLLRWALRHNDIELLWSTQIGITGFAAFAVTPLICWPMLFPPLKKGL